MSVGARQAALPPVAHCRSQPLQCVKKFQTLTFCIPIVFAAPHVLLAAIPRYSRAERSERGADGARHCSR